jgi:hypothetical protein
MINTQCGNVLPWQSFTVRLMFKFLFGLHSCAGKKGDTDSLFIALRGKTKDQAFIIGEDIASTITALNPAPIKLKFEKVRNVMRSFF